MREGKYFTCQCKRCEDPTELGTNMSSIACNKCNELCTFYDSLLWQCTACGAQIENGIVEELMTQAMEELCNGIKL